MCLMHIQSVSKVYDQLKAVDGVSFKIQSGESLAIVGESGSGKSTLARLLLGIEEPTAGQVFFKGENLCAASLKNRRKIQKQMQMIYQNVDGSLNPRMTAYQCISEPLDYMTHLSQAQKKEAVYEAVKAVGLDEKKLKAYPHAFSGGQKQRIAIARALTTRPAMMICDEVTSGLDVSIQAQILNLFRSIQSLYGMTLVFITHDLAVAQWLSQRILVMHKGELVEILDHQGDEILPQHPYSQRLFSSALQLNEGRRS